MFDRLLVTAITFSIFSLLRNSSETNFPLKMLFRMNHDTGILSCCKIEMDFPGFRKACITMALSSLQTREKANSFLLDATLLVMWRYWALLILRIYTISYGGSTRKNPASKGRRRNMKMFSLLLQFEEHDWLLVVT